MSGQLTRRELLMRSSLIPFAVAAGTGLTSLKAFGREPIKRIGGPKLKLSLNAYSFSKALNDQIKGRGPGMSLFELVDFCAEQNFDALDPTGYFFPGYPGIPADKYINDFKKHCFEQGLDISGTGIRNNFAAPDAASRAQDVQHAKEWIEVAARMGAPVMRVFAGPEPEGHAWDEAAKWMVDCLREVAEHGEKYGVLVGVQNHGDMLKTAEQTIQIVQAVDSEWFGVIVDTGYFMTEDPYIDIAAVIPYAVNFQVKESPFGKGSPIRTDVKRLIRIIREGGYRGYIPIETLSVKGEPYDPFTLVPAFLAEVREAVESQA